ncbi:MAG: hypothetical protein WB608_16135 [Terracidiphilus sp.]
MVGICHHAANISTPSTNPPDFPPDAVTCTGRGGVPVPDQRSWWVRVRVLARKMTKPIAANAAGQACGHVHPWALGGQGPEVYARG